MITMINEKVIIRTESAGVWFGTLAEKDGKEVILYNARRMWYWKTKKGISLSAIAVNGIDADECKIAVVVPKVWLEAIEIIPCGAAVANEIESAENA